jgi:hypothetical protein
MQPSLSVSFDASAGRSSDWQVAQRVQFVVAQIAKSLAGQPPLEVAQEITTRLRGMGVTPIPNDVQRYALAIAQLPQVKT